MSFVSPIDDASSDKENIREGLCSPLMVPSPLDHSTPKESAQFTQMRYRANICLQKVLGAREVFNALPLEYCKRCRTNHPSAYSTSILTLNESDRVAPPTERLRLFIRYIQHGLDCKNLDCYSKTCMKAKKFLEHVNSCRDCEVYSQFMAVCCEHSVTCRGDGCSIAYCELIRQLESPRTARKIIREEQTKSAKTPKEKKNKKQRDLKETPLGRNNRLQKKEAKEYVNVIQTESSGVTGSSMAPVATPEVPGYRTGIDDRRPAFVYADRSALEDGEIRSDGSSNEDGSSQYSESSEETDGIMDTAETPEPWAHHGRLNNAKSFNDNLERTGLEDGEIRSMNESQLQTDTTHQSNVAFLECVEAQKALYNEVMEAIACKEEQETVDDKYMKFQAKTFETYRVAAAIGDDASQTPEMREIRAEVDKRFIRVSKLDWRRSAKLAVEHEIDEEEEELDHHESCRILNEKEMETENNQAVLINSPMYEKTVKTVIRKVERMETAETGGFARVSGSLYSSFSELSNYMGTVVLLIIAIFIYLINN